MIIYLNEIRKFLYSHEVNFYNINFSENRTTEYLDGREIQVIVSTIVVEKATSRHAGNYSCVVPEKARATVAVHVLNGKFIFHSLI
jgi:hypothetical protein